MINERFTNLVKRLEDVAERHPTLYKARVILLACLGYIYIFLVVVLLLGVIASLGVLAYTTPSLVALLIKLGLKLGIPILVLIAITARALWVRLEAPSGIRLAPSDCPELFHVLAEIRTRLKAPRTHTVLLNADFNAGIVQIPRLGLLGWQKNYLLLGLPLMQALSPEQFTAVLAHEYGHLSGAHSKLAAWVYRIRITWYRLMEALDQERHWGRFVFQKFFDWYAPFFSAYSFVLARSNEYEADRCATEVAGVTHAAHALINTHLRGAYLDNHFWPAFYRQANDLPAPPTTPFKAMSQALHEPLPDVQTEWLTKAMEVKTGLDDTHPSLSDRLAAIGAQPDVPPKVASAAAERFLGDAYESLRQNFDDQWHTHTMASWGERHQYVQSAREKMAVFEASRKADTLTAAEAWEYGQLLHDLEGEDVALPLYLKVFALDPTHTGGKFFAGQAMLRKDDDAGIALIEQAMEADANLILPGCDIVCTYLHEHERDEEAARFYEKAQQRYEIVARAQQERSELPYDAEYRSPKLDEEERSQLAAQLKEFAGVAHAYVVRKVVYYMPEHPLYVVGVVLNPKVGTTGIEQELANSIRFPYDLVFVSLARPNKRMLKIMREVPLSKLF